MTTITVQLLSSLGCTYEVDHYDLRMHGYSFQFFPGNVAWNFITPGYRHGHAVTHLEECFGFLAEDMFDAGRDDKAREIQECLKMKGMEE